MIWMVGWKKTSRPWGLCGSPGLPSETFSASVSLGLNPLLLLFNRGSIGVVIGLTAYQLI
jgi:hypothetical protein